MRASLPLLCLCVLTSVPASAQMANVVGSGHVVDISRNVGDFTGIAVSAGIQVKVEAGPKGPLVLRGEDNVVPHIKTEIKGSTLHIGFEDHLSVNTSQQVLVTVHVPRLDDLGASGGSQLDANTPTGNKLRVSVSGGAHIHLAASVKPRRLELEASGAGEATIDEIDSAEVRLDISGASQVALAGNAQAIELELSGAAQLNAKKLNAGSLKVNGSGGSRARLHVAGPVQGSLSGGASLKVGNEAQVSVDTSGGAEVSK